eukprot:m.54598 g.54598  ORF g.54598 m.54598 type:complete len:663 (+) comp6604_c1_seq1:62-2050(+)
MANLRDVCQEANHGTINSFLNRTFHFSTAVLEFIQKKSLLQKQYADQLDTLFHSYSKQVTDLLEKKKYSKEDNKVFELWDTLLLVTEAEIRSFSELSESINKKVVTPLNDAIEKRRQDVKEINKDKTFLETVMHKLEADADKACQARAESIKPLVSHGFFSRKRSASSLKADDTSLVNARTTHNDYVMVLAQANAERRRYYDTDLPALMDSLEAVQRQLEESTRSAFADLASCTGIAFEPMAALQEKLRSVAAAAEVTEDIPLFVQTLYKAPYEPPRHIPFSTPNEKGLDAAFSDNNIMLQGSEVALGQTSQRLSEEVTTLANQIAEAQKKVVGMEKLKSTYEPGSAASNEITGQINAANKEMRALHMKMAGRHAVLALLQSSNVRDEDGGTRHLFKSHIYKKTVKCFQCQKRINILNQGLRCSKCRINLHDKCSVHVTSCKIGDSAAAPAASSSSLDAADDIGEDEYADVWSDEDDDGTSEATTPASGSSATPTSAPAPAATPVPGPRGPPARPPPPARPGAPQPQGPRAVALYDYEATSKEELTISYGEIMTLDECVDGEPWWFFFCNKCMYSRPLGTHSRAYIYKRKGKKKHEIRTCGSGQFTKTAGSQPRPHGSAWWTAARLRRAAWEQRRARQKKDVPRGWPRGPVGTRHGAWTKRE